MGINECHKDRLAVLAFLHDFGKCNWGFQAKAKPDAAQTAGHVAEAVALLASHPETWPPPWRELVRTVCGWFTTPEGAGTMLLAAISHHGRPIRWIDGDPLLLRYWSAHSDYDPLSALTDLATAVYRAFPQAFLDNVGCIEAHAPLQQRFAGLVMLADWIGSDTQFFPYRDDPDQDRAAFATEQAARALKAIGLLPPSIRPFPPLAVDAGFRKVFGWDADATPSELQRVLARELPLDESTRLVLVESDTGSGKTESALAWFFRLYAKGEVDGLYFALPTRVAARELYGRVLAAIRRAFPEPDTRPTPVLLAVPGYVRVDGKHFEKHALTDPEGVLWEDDARMRRSERLWAAERPKRFLAAPVAVGTVDQALLSVLKVKHSLLRSVCLDRHLLVVDEVHASDTYMREVLHVLLEGHLARGGRAMLLSATLGESAASRFFGRPCEPVQIAAFAPYPRLSTRAKAIPLTPSRPSREIELDLESSLECADAISDAVIAAIQAGARVLVVCNTVGRANALQRAVEARLDAVAPTLRGALFAVNGVPCPHHGRFARVDREMLDAEVSRRLGKGSTESPLLLIGTQTVEQSLDIDADWLITDLCPMDVLLQRLGRLHRHAREHRPAAYAKARARVRLPEKPIHEYLDSNGQLRGPAGLGAVYADGRVLACTVASLVADPMLRLPDQNRARIEAATHPESWAGLDPNLWRSHIEYLEGDYLADVRQADRSVIPTDEPFGELHFGSVDGERVLSRLADPVYEIPLSEPRHSPFGAMIDRIPVPARYLSGHLPPETVETISVEDGLRFRIGPAAFRYTRFGLEKDDA